MTDGLKPIARRLMVDANGYELFNCPVSPATEHSSVELPDNLPIDSSGAKWFVAASQVRRDLTFAPPVPSGRLLPLRRMEH